MDENELGLLISSSTAVSRGKIKKKKKKESKKKKENKKNPKKSKRTHNACGGL